MDAKTTIGGASGTRRDRRSRDGTPARSRIGRSFLFLPLRKEEATSSEIHCRRRCLENSGLGATPEEEIVVIAMTTSRSAVRRRRPMKRRIVIVAPPSKDGGPQKPPPIVKNVRTIPKRKRRFRASLPHTDATLPPRRRQDVITVGTLPPRLPAAFTFPARSWRRPDRAAAIFGSRGRRRTEFPFRVRTPQRLCRRRPRLPPNRPASFAKSGGGVASVTRSRHRESIPTGMGSRPVRRCRRRPARPACRDRRRATSLRGEGPPTSRRRGGRLPMRRNDRGRRVLIRHSSSSDCPAAPRDPTSLGPPSSLRPAIVMAAARDGDEEVLAMRPKRDQPSKAVATTVPPLLIVSATATVRGTIRTLPSSTSS